MKSLFPLFLDIGSKPVTGLTVTTSSTVLFYLNLVTPYLSFLGVCAGLAASLFSLYVGYKNYKQSRKLDGK